MLVGRVRRGEPNAFGELYERHVDRVYRYFSFRTRDEPVARELTHDVFVRAIEGLGQLRDVERFGGWLLRIAHNTLVNHWQRAGRRLVETSLESHETGEPRPVEDSDDGLARAEHRLRLESLLAGAEALNDRQREVLALRFAAGLSVREAAGVMACSEQAVKQLQRRALLALRRSLDEGETGR